MLDGWHISRRGAAPALLVTLLLSGSVSAPAADLYWSGSGNWDTTSTIWGTVTGGPYDAATWNNSTPDAATFQGTAGTITLAEAITAAGLTFETTGYTLSGNTLTLSGTPTIATGTGSATIASVLAGTSGFAKTGSGTLTLSAANSISGAATVSAGRIVLGADAALGTTAVTLDGGSIERNAAGATVANAIAVGAAGGTILGRTSAIDNYMTLSGQLTGSGSLTVQGLVNLSNTSNTYAGTLTISNASASYLRLSASEVLGDTATITGAGGNSYLRLDGGVTETIGGLSGSGEVFGAGAGTAHLKAGGGTYAGVFRNNDSTFVLEKVAAGTLTLNRGGGNGAAIGGLEVSGGTLRLDAGGVGFKAGYFTGGQSITVRSGATLAVNQAWNIGSSNAVVVDGGTLAFTTATDGPNYANILTLQNGGSMTGDWRLGDEATASLTTSGNLTNSIAGSFRLTKQSSGNTAWTVNVADGAAATDLDITAVISDLTGRTGATVVKTGAGTMRLAAANSYTGATTIAAGGVTLASGAALGSSPVTLTSATTGTSPVSLLLETAATVANAISVAANGTGTVTLGSTDSATGTNREFSGVVTLARNLTLQAGSTDRTTFTNQITGTGNLTISSPFASGRRVVLDRPSGSANNFTGDVTLGAGAYLQLGVANSLGNRTVPDTATISFTDSNSQLRPAPSGSGDSETVGTLVSLAAGAGRVDMFTGSAFTLKIGGDGESGTFSGTIVNSSGALTIEKVGSGTQTLSGANTYSGGTVVTAGSLVATTANAFGTSGTVTLGSAATGSATTTVILDTTAGDVILSRPITIAAQGTGTATLGDTATANRIARFSGAVTLNRDVTLSGNAGDRTDFTGGITGTGNVTIAGAGRIVYATAANSYAGSTTILGGSRLQLSDGTPTATSLLPDNQTVTVTGTLRIAKGGNSETIGGLAGAGTVEAFFSNNTLEVGGGDQSASFGGVLQNNNGVLSVVKTGTGAQVFTSANSYTGGTTINAGRLTAGHANALGTSGGITINSGGTLGIADGITFTRPLAINAGGKVRTGNNSTVALPSAAALSAWESQSATGNQTFASILNGSGVTVPSALATAWTANPDPATYFSDILSLDGTGTGNTYVLSMAYSGSFGAMNIWYRENTSGPFTPLGTSFQGNVAWTSGFTTVGQYGVDTSAGTVWVVTDHNSQFVIVPEPGALGLVAAGLAGGFWYLRRRRAPWRP